MSIINEANITKLEGEDIIYESKYGMCIKSGLGKPVYLMISNMRILIKLIVIMCVFLLIITVTGCSTDDAFERMEKENSKTIKQMRAERKSFLKKNISINIVEDGKYKLSFNELEVVDVFITKDATVPQDDIEYAEISGLTGERYYFVVFNGTFKNISGEELEFGDIQFKINIRNLIIGSFYTKVIKSKDEKNFDRSTFETGEEKEVQFAVSMPREDALIIMGQDMKLTIDEKINEIKIQ